MLRRKYTTDAWIADVKLQNAQLEAKEMSDNATAIKTRLTSVLTIAVSLCSASSALYAALRQPIILFMAILFFVVVVICLIGLWINRWTKDSIPPHGIRYAIGDPGNLTITQAKNQLAMILHEGTEENFKTLTKLRCTLRIAYIILGLSPVLSLLFFAIYASLSC